MTSRILFVCLGNICRSPTAEAVFRARAPGYQVDSAGTSGWHIGEPPYDAMQQATLARGYDMSDLRARQFTVADFTRFDLIIGMDAANIADIEALRPSDVQTPVHLFTDYVAAEGIAGVPDPYYTRNFDATLSLIERASDGLLATLTPIP